jgi:hypothetical protein
LSWRCVSVHHHVIAIIAIGIIIIVGRRAGGRG